MSTTVTPSTTDHLSVPSAPAPVPAPPAVPSGDPSVLGLPIFAVGSIVLGLQLLGFVPAAASAGTIPIILAATGIGLTVAAVWAAAVGQSLVAAVFGIFAGFWLSYATLVMGLTHDWFKVPAADVTDTVTMFQLTWAIVIGALTLATLRLPVSFTAVFGLITVALVLLIFAGQNASTTLTHLAGVVVLAFAAIGVYLFASAADIAGGGDGYPLGAPLVK